MVSDTQIQTEEGKRRAAPRTNVYETEVAYVVVADIPGVAESDVEVSVENEVLRLSGKTAEAPQGYELVYSEYDDVDFERRFALGERVDGEKIAATLKEGVLEVSLPKKQAALARQVEVTVA
jgi:HSP20 family protein